MTNPPSGGEPGTDWAWLTGFECSTFPQVDMDELYLTQHDRFWASDILRARDAGCRTLRYGIRWHIVNPAPHTWDWSSLDGPMELMRELDMEPIVDLFHFGVPTWLPEAVASPVFPDFQAELCQRFARRYPWVRWYTPTNEPYIMSQFGGEIAAWFPFRQGPQSFALITRNVARGLCDGWAAIRAERPDARMMVSDTCEYWHPLDEASRPIADLRNERRFLMHELYGGRVDRDHPFWERLVNDGIPEAEMWWFLENPAPLDLVGLDHYPHSEHQLRTDERGLLVDETRPIEEQHGPGELARQYFQRLGRPLIFAETGAPGDDERRTWWLHRLVDQVRTVRGEGVPLIGITWWGLLDQIDWGNNLRRFRYDIDPTGLYRLEWRDGVAGQPHGRLERIPTATLDAWRAYAAAPVVDAVGELAAVSWPRGEAELW